MVSLGNYGPVQVKVVVLADGQDKDATVKELEEWCKQAPEGLVRTFEDNNDHFSGFQARK